MDNIWIISQPFSTCVEQLNIYGQPMDNLWISNTTNNHLRRSPRRCLWRGPTSESAAPAARKRPDPGAASRHMAGWVEEKVEMMENDVVKICGEWKMMENLIGDVGNDR